MEDTLRVEERQRSNNRVLILVLMEDTLRGCVHNGIISEDELS